MQERRAELRHRTLKAGRIAFNRAAGISCMVRNLSPIGACLEVESLIGVPEAFTLVVESDRINQPCHIVWRKENRIGVTFD